MLTQHYWPEPIGSAPYLTDIGEWLAAHGHEVRVFTCRPHYPDGFVSRAYRHGRRDEETRSGALIERVAPFQPWRRGALGRMIREALFLMQGLGALASGRIRRCPLVVSLCPSVFTVLLGIAARRRHGHHVVMVHDIQSGLATGLGMIGGRHIAALMRWLERVVFNRADMILVLSDSMRKHLRGQGVRKPIEILPIWVDTGAVRPARAPRGNAVTVIYSGNFGKKQGLSQVIDMAELLERRNSPVRVLLRGEGSEGTAIAAEIEFPRPSAHSAGTTGSAGTLVRKSVRGRDPSRAPGRQHCRLRGSFQGLCHHGQRPAVRRSGTPGKPVVGIERAFLCVPVRARR